MIFKNGFGVALVAALLVLSGCNSANFKLGNNERVGPSAPLGTPRGQSVDGMTVGDRLMEAGEYELAVNAYRRSAAEDGITAETLSAMGSANLRLGRLHQSKTLLDRALELDDKSVSAWNNLGVVLMNLNEAQQARSAFRVAFGLDNGDSDLIRDNLILSEKLLREQAIAESDLADFRLVRYGNGQYYLVGE